MTGILQDIVRNFQEQVQLINQSKQGRHFFSYYTVKIMFIQSEK